MPVPQHVEMLGLPGRKQRGEGGAIELLSERFAIDWGELHPFVMVWTESTLFSNITSPPPNVVLREEKRDRRAHV